MVGTVLSRWRSVALLLCLAERDNLGDIPNVYNYQTFLETDRAGYIIRQWLFSSLYDRIRSEHQYPAQNAF